MDVWNDIVYLLSRYGHYYAWGALSTIILSIVGTGVGLILGTFLALGKRLTIKRRDIWIIKGLKGLAIAFCSAYSVIMRGTPMMVQALIFKYGTQMMGVNWNLIAANAGVFNGWFYAGLIVITLNTAAYMGEIVISGLNGIDRGQYEGGYSLGMSRSQTFVSIVFPQAIKNSIPTIGNEWVVNIKDSSVLNVIGVAELYFEASQAAQSNYRYMGTYLIIAVIYLIMTLLVTFLLKVVGTKLSGGKVFSMFHFRKESYQHA